MYDLSDANDINELFLMSDVLITDYSSVYFDYANLRRPILFLHMIKMNMQMILEDSIYHMNQTYQDLSLKQVKH